MPSSIQVETHKLGKNAAKHQLKILHFNRLYLEITKSKIFQLRLLAIDYGTKRVGIAVSDPMQIIATGLDTVANKDVMKFLKEYTSKEAVETFIVGEPLDPDGEPTATTRKIHKFVESLKKLFPDIPVELVDESMTSQNAARILVESGVKKMKRREKGRIDRISAILILQEYIENKHYS